MCGLFRFFLQSFFSCGSFPSPARTPASPMSRNGGGAVLLGSPATLIACSFEGNSALVCCCVSFQVQSLERLTCTPVQAGAPFVDTKTSGMGGAVLGVVLEVQECQFSSGVASSGGHLALFSSAPVPLLRVRVCCPAPFFAFCILLDICWRDAAFSWCPSVRCLLFFGCAVPSRRIPCSSLGELSLGGLSSWTSVPLLRW